MRRGWRGKKIEHLSLRILALLLAVILWFVATGRPQSNLSLDQRVIETAVAAENVPGDLELSEAPGQVEVAVEGPRLILPFDAQDVTAYIDLSGLGPGRHELPVQVRAPTSIAVRSIRPETVTVLLEERKMRQVEVRVALRSVSPGVSVTVLAVRPEVMNVYGPASLVDRVAHILAEASPSGAGSVFAEALPVDASGARVAGVATEAPRVEVVLGVEELDSGVMEGD